MSIFDHIRKQTSKRRKPPRKAYKPTKEDLQLLQFIKVNLAQGFPVIIQPPTAKVLKKAEGLSDTETLIRTGYWVRDETNG